MKPTLEEYVTNLKAELKKEIAKREESEYRHALTAEALENLVDAVDTIPVMRRGKALEANRAARLALNGIEHD